MKMFHNNKESRKAKRAIELFFRKGGRLTTDQVITEYFDPRTPLNVIIAKSIATRWICEITQLLNKEGRMFGRLNKAGEYGLVTTKAEAESVATRAYTITKGHVMASARKLMNGSRQKLLQLESETIDYERPLLTGGK